MELEVFNKLKEQLQPMVPLITEISELIASLDVMCSFAQHAVDENSVRPMILSNITSSEMCIVNGRHPVVESLIELDDSYSTSEFVPNSTIMGHSDVDAASCCIDDFEQKELISER